MAAEITHIDFDGAVDLTIKFFGNSPLNRVFLAEYIGNFYVTEGERRVQVTPQDMNLRLLSVDQKKNWASCVRPSARSGWTAFC